MAIQVRWWDGKGDYADPKVGSGGVSNIDLYHALLAKRVAGVGGVSAGADTVTISFADDTLLWFTVANGVPRILVQMQKGK